MPGRPGCAASAYSATADAKDEVRQLLTARDVGALRRAMNFSAARLRALLETHAPAAATGFLVALSGGKDSASLLAALAQMGRFRDLPIRAVHVDHGLQPAAAEFCRACGPPAGPGGGRRKTTHSHDVRPNAAHVFFTLVAYSPDATQDYCGYEYSYTNIR